MMTIDEIKAMAKEILGDAVGVKEFADGGVEVRWQYSAHVQLPLPHRPERNPEYVADELGSFRAQLAERLAFFAAELAKGQQNGVH